MISHTVLSAKRDHDNHDGRCVYPTCSMVLAGAAVGAANRVGSTKAERLMGVGVSEDPWLDGLVQVYLHCLFLRTFLGCSNGRDWPPHIHQYLVPSSYNPRECPSVVSHANVPCEAAATLRHLLVLDTESVSGEGSRPSPQGLSREGHLQDSFPLGHSR